MRRLLGFLLVIHGLAHAGAGMWATRSAPPWVTTTLWIIATTGFVLAGAGLLGVSRLDVRWRPLAASAAATSLALLALSWHPVLMIGAVVDAAILVDCIPFAHEIVARRIGLPIHPARHRLARPLTIIVLLLAAYPAGLILLRPWHTRWGSSANELSASLPGDALVHDARYRIDHAVTIHASADAVWPWLAQIGQDRAGFYSYDWLERLIGDPIYNADRIRPEWQRIARGDLVRAAPADYLGGRLGRDLGWRVLEIVPGRALVLEGWGAFVLRPIDDSTTRLIVRTRGDGTPSFAAVALAPVGLLVFEPAHFIMQRGMLLGIKKRAEHAWGMTPVP
jgi:hypothetical protein